MEDFANAILDAIARRVCLELSGDGFGLVVEPHVLGRGPDGAALLRAWQIRGGLGPAQAPGWQLIDLRAVTRAVATAEPAYMPRIGYRRPDPDITHIDARV